jgi:outer membrane protein OmpA-like peptidoglycan-associated protein
MSGKDHEHQGEGEGHKKAHKSHAPHGGGHEEGHEGAPEWLISFADNVMLQMGFFVILLAMNMGPKSSSSVGGQPSDTPRDYAHSGEFYDFIIAIREGFNNPVDILSTDPKDAPLIRRIKERQGGPADQDAPRGDHEKVQSVRPSDLTSLGAAVPFEDGSDLLSASAREVIADIAQRLRGLNWVVELRGHASPSEGLRDPDRGLTLSYRRALAVRQVLLEHGVRREQMRIVAIGDGNRVVPRTYDREKDRANQRVEVVVTNEALPPDAFAAPASP